MTAALHLLSSLAMLAAVAVRCQEWTYKTIDPVPLGYTVAKVLPTYFRGDTRTKTKKQKVFYVLSAYNFIVPELGPPDRPENAVYRITKPIKTMRHKTEQPQSEIVLGDETDIAFPGNIVEAPKRMRRIFGRSRDKPLAISTGRFRTGRFDVQPGQILLLDPQSKNVVPVSGNATKWIYGKAVFKDVNGDGLLDILTVRMADFIVDPRARYFPHAGQLVWFQQPRNVKSARKGYWEEHILVNAEEATNEGNPTSSFDFQDIDGDGVEELVAVDFWGGFVRLYYLESGGSMSWANASAIRSFDLVSPSIDGTFGFAYDVHFGDLNNDGKMDVYAANHVLSMNGKTSVNPGHKPQLAAFELADDFKTSRNFTKHIIDDTYRWRGSHSWSTGNADHFYPPNGFSPANGTKPLIANAGDGSSGWYLYKPASEDPSDWTYEKTVLHTNNETDFIAPHFVKSTAGEVTMVVCGAFHVGSIYSFLISKAGA